MRINTYTKPTDMITIPGQITWLFGPYTLAATDSRTIQVMYHAANIKIAIQKSKRRARSKVNACLIQGKHQDNRQLTASLKQSHRPSSHMPGWGCGMPLYATTTPGCWNCTMDGLTGTATYPCGTFIGC